MRCASVMKVAASWTKAAWRRNIETAAAGLLGRVALETEHVLERLQPVVADHRQSGDEARHRIVGRERVADLEGMTIMRGYYQWSRQ